VLPGRRSAARALMERVLTEFECDLPSERCGQGVRGGREIRTPLTCKMRGTTPTCGVSYANFPVDTYQDSIGFHHPQGDRMPVSAERR
jgi:hypothetical protein